MRCFLICSGVHGRIESLEWLHQIVRQLRPDGVLFAGGVLSRERVYAPTASTSWGYTKSDTDFLQAFFDSLGGLGVFTAIIPGVLDAPLDQFLRLGMNAEIEYPRLHVVHATPVEEEDVAVLGLGASISDYTATDIGYYSRSLADYYLRSLWTTSRPRTVLLLPEPPQSWLGDVDNLRRASALVSTYYPGLCVLGSPSGGQGADRVGDSLIINPGHLSEGRAVWLDWHRPKGEQVEFLDRQRLASLHQHRAPGRGEVRRRRGARSRVCAK